jgi:hypothetical protein
MVNQNKACSSNRNDDNHGKSNKSQYQQLGRLYTQPEATQIVRYATQKIHFLEDDQHFMCCGRVVVYSSANFLVKLISTRSLPILLTFSIVFYALVAERHLALVLAIDRYTE